jgi:hypothetical protein
MSKRDNPTGIDKPEPRIQSAKHHLPKLNFLNDKLTAINDVPN